MGLKAMQKFLALAGLCLACGPLMAGAQEFRVAILPNELFEKGIEKTRTAESVNSHDVQFAIFTGDSKDGSSRCDDAVIGRGLREYFMRLRVPTLYALGDNEWTDCHRTSNGGYDPLERLAFLRKFFFSRNTTQGPGPIRVERQGEPGAKYSENSRFIYNNVLFVALNVVGSNNNLVATPEQCRKYSKRTRADCNAASAEFRERSARNRQWLSQAFARARQEGLAGIAVVIQADIYFPYELGDHADRRKFLQNLDDSNGFTGFFRTLVRETHRFAGQVALISGDSHYFKLDKAMFNRDGAITSNFTRMVTFGGRETSWVEMTVRPDRQSVFSFQPVILPVVHSPRAVLPGLAAESPGTGSGRR